MPQPLTATQIAAYERDGVVFPLTAFDAAQAATYRQALERDGAQTERARSRRPGSAGPPPE